MLFLRPQITLLYVIHLLIVIIRLMLSVSLCPKAITLSGFHCIEGLSYYTKWVVTTDEPLLTRTYYWIFILNACVSMSFVN